jgi:PiT family inorganic phosphate transporter
MFTIFKYVFKNLNLSKTNRRFRRLQAVTAGIQAFAHGTNDAQKSMGIITMALVSNNLIKPVNGVAADLSSALIIFGASKFGLPVSTTHVISSAIMGVGSSYRVKGVKWGTGKKMIITWFITLPISATLAAVIYMFMSIFV